MITTVEIYAQETFPESCSLASVGNFRLECFMEVIKADVSAFRDTDSGLALRE